MSTVSRTENCVLMAQAREALQGKWGLAIGTVFIYNLILYSTQSFSIGMPDTPYLDELVIAFILIATVVSLLIVGPMNLGLAIFTLSLSRKQEAELSQIFSGFGKLKVGLLAYVLQGIFVFLWSLLLVVPGIIASLSYSQTVFIIADNDSITALEAITKSKEMMRGNKGKYFCLGWRFFGWSLLCILTLGIGFLWLNPYIQVSLAQFYDDLKEYNEGSVAGPNLPGDAEPVSVA